MPTYPIELPTLEESGDGFFQFEWLKESAVAKTQSSMTYATEKFAHAGKRRVARVRLPDLLADEWKAWEAFLMQLNGDEGTFYFRPLAWIGDFLNQRGNGSGTIQVDGAQSATNSLDSKGWGTSETGILVKGDYLSINNRIFQVIEESVDSDGSGDATFEIWPNITNVADNDSIKLGDDVTGIFQMRGGFPAMRIDDDGIVRNFEFLIEEVVPVQGLPDVS